MFKSYLRAGFPVIWCHTLEVDHSQETLLKIANKTKFKTFTWNILDGITDLTEKSTEAIQDPLEMLKWFGRQKEKTVLFAHNLHLFLQSAEMVQAIQNGVTQWKRENKTLVILSSVVSLPVELDRLVTVMEMDLPARKHLSQILDDVIAGGNLTSPENRDAVLDAATGLTAFETENAFALSAIEHKAFLPEVISRQKAKLVEQSSSLEMSSFQEKFSDLGGLENLKRFTNQIARSVHSRGILLVGIPGCGKSLFAKALGNELLLPTFSLDFGRVFGSKIGESEERIRRALKTVDAMSPSILFLDEMEKGIGGINSSNQTDGGTGSRVFGSFLTWLNDHTSRVFVIATTNNISQLPPEFLRSERWDGIFFVDLPTQGEREAILKIHKKTFQITDEQIPDMTDWSGAEIRSLCRISAMMGSTLSEASRFVVPLSKSMPEQVESLRKWAKARAIPAGDIPVPDEKPEAKRKLANVWE